VAVDRIKDVHKAAVLEDRKKEKGSSINSSLIRNTIDQRLHRTRRTTAEDGIRAAPLWTVWRWSLPIKIFRFFEVEVEGIQGCRRGQSRRSWYVLYHTFKHTASSCHTDKSIEEILEQLVNGEATPEEQEIRNREHRGASKKLKDVEYCAEQKSTDLELVGTWVLVSSHGSIAKYISDVDGAAGLMRVWKQSRFHSC
jgi:hypothetical protein